MVSDMIYDMAVVDLEGPVHSFVITQHSCFDNTLYFHITLMLNGMIVL